MRQSLVLRREDVEPHGMGCPICHRPLSVGEEVVEVFEGVMENPTHLTGTDESHIPIVLIVCGECGNRDDIYEKVAEVK